MGKLRVDKEDITRLAKVFDKDVVITDDHLDVDLGGPKLSLNELKTNGFFEQNGIRFRIDARFASGTLDVDFD